MRKVIVGTEHNRSDYDRTELFVGDANEVKAVYKALWRNGYKHGVYPTFLNKQTFKEGRVYGLTVDYHGDCTADFCIVTERVIAGWYADGLI